MKEELSIQYRTIARQDQQFMSHLLGTFSHYQRALPVDCFFANSSDERITFKIVPTKDIQSPGNFLAFLIGARLILLPLTMGPTLPVFFFCLAMGWNLNPWVVISSFLAILFWHTASFLLNDYYDHISGTDRRSSLGGSRIIQKGWVRAEQVRLWSQLCWLLGAVFGLPALWSRPWVILFVGGMAGAIMMGVSRLDRSENYYGLRNVLVFIGMGPLLTIGLSMGISHHVHPHLLWLGIVFGLNASLCIQLRNLETLLADSQSRSNTLMSRLGLERSRIFIFTQLVVLTGCTMSFTLISLPSLAYALLLIPAWGSALRLAIRLRAVQSPLSSKLLGLWREGLAMHLLLDAGMALIFSMIYLGRG